ncbi:hypothetical protein FEM41_19925 [Jejubacter calystegiae]|uniref:DUF4128 domain-containing protein n=1 Tax=Jejubacter calystegiae TaxID=2579935 RepID=A0A4P8YP62_9ENTR|nr:DUF4128 domain-containing protein [Jejubacter calystegiae]QCT21758.1 hypothetical protein FEM41_19925 [Jejubacter calystegiae]
MIPDISAVLSARLGQWADSQGIPVAWDNVAFEPPSGAPYLAAHDMPATPRTLDLSLTCRTFPGVYQINVVVPAGSGRSSAGALARQIAALFPEGQELAGDGFTCWVSGPPAIFAGVTTDTTYTVPVSLNYRADIVS